jgi:hypothetical protein
MRRGKKKKDKEANLGKAATFDVEDGADMENPLADGYEPAAAVVEAAPPPVPVAAAKPPAPAPAPNAFAMTTGGAAAGGLSFNQMIALNQSEMTENELTDLTYAFKAADMDGGGSIDPTEFGVMMAVMGVPLAMMTINRILGEAKSGFAAWIKMSDEANTQKVLHLPSRFVLLAPFDAVPGSADAVDLTGLTLMRRPKRCGRSATRTGAGPWTCERSASS